MTVKLDRLIRFVEAARLAKLAREQEAVAAERLADAERHLDEVWQSLSPGERQEMNDAYEKADPSEVSNAG